MDGIGPGPWEWLLIAGVVPAVLEAAIISVGVYLALRLGFKRMTYHMDSFGSGDGNAMEIVRGRYAKGEISRREYEQLRDDLATEAGRTGIRKEKERTR